MNRSSRADGVFQPKTLDVDETILDRNLKIVGGGGGDASSAPKLKAAPSLMPDNCPVVKVTPTPGICVKTKNSENRKVFLNLCKIQQIPPPPPLSEEELRRIIADDDYTTDFRVPMSLGAPREERDKSGDPCTACDVAVNSVWFEDAMLDSLTFTTFVVNVAMEGLCDKYGDDVNLDRQNWTVLRNKKYMGGLQRHHIQQRANSHSEGAKIMEVKEKEKPELAVVKEPVKDPERLVATVELPGEKSKFGLTLDIGEDRLVVDSERYSLDVFLPFRIDQAGCDAVFDRDSRRLTVTMPLVR